jgi:hypothetical protein
MTDLFLLIMLDDRIVRTDWDAGFKEGRQYGRGKSGGQVRIYILMSCFKDISNLTVFGSNSKYHQFEI